MNGSSIRQAPEGLSDRKTKPIWQQPLLHALRHFAPAIAVAALFLFVWHGIVLWFDIPPILLPTPGRVAKTVVEKWEPLLAGAKVTFLSAIVGFGCSIAVGCLVALLFSQSRALRRALMPYVIFLQTVPIVAIAPLLITWSGYTFQSVVLITITISVFPIISNVTAGLLAIDKNLEDLFRIYQANRFSVMLRLRIPTAVRYLVLGMRISSGLAVIGAIMGDFFVGSGADHQGLGTLMTVWGARQQTDGVIAALLMSTTLGILFFGLVGGIERFILGRWTHHS
jgi:NitT/TauT family transport system permease protein